MTLAKVLMESYEELVWCSMHTVCVTNLNKMKAKCIEWKENETHNGVS